MGLDYEKARDEAALEYSSHYVSADQGSFMEGSDWGYRKGLEAASEHLLRLAERTDAGSTQGIGIALVIAAREILELGKGDL